MSDQVVYLVCGHTPHESWEFVKVFENKSTADEFAESCRKHESKRPEMPHSDDDDKAWARYEKRFKRWRDKHPAGACSNDFYETCELPFVEYSMTQVRGKWYGGVDGELIADGEYREVAHKLQSHFNAAWSAMTAKGAAT